MIPSSHPLNPSRRRSLGNPSGSSPFPGELVAAIRPVHAIAQEPLSVVCLLRTLHTPYARVAALVLLFLFFSSFFLFAYIPSLHVFISIGSPIIALVSDSKRD